MANQLSVTAHSPVQRFTNPIRRYGATLASGAAVIGASSYYGYGVASAALVATGAVGYKVFQSLSSKTQPVVNLPQPSPMKEQSEPDKMDVGVAPPNVVPNDELKAYTKEELEQHPLIVRQQMIMERTRQLREIEAQKVLLCGLMTLQNEAELDEREAQEMINKKGNRLKGVGGDGKSTGDNLFSEICPKSLVPEPDNIKMSCDDVKPIERQELVKSPPKPIEIFILPDASKEGNAPSPEKLQSVGIKRKSTETLSRSSEVLSPPTKKAKIISGPVTVEPMMKCSNCGFSESQLWATDPKTKESFCYGCHTARKGLCEYKPKTGGRACFKKRKSGETLCRDHMYTKKTTKLVLDDE